jgi:hypothetical protein
MKAVVVVESMYGNTRSIAEAIAEGLGAAAEVRVVPPAFADAALVKSADLLVVGGPTHGHSMSRAVTREAAIKDAAKPGSALELDPAAEGPGVRDFVGDGDRLEARAAAFDTRIGIPAWLSGRASKGIARGLQRKGCTLIAKPESFLVTKENHLRPGEIERAREWGAELARAFEPQPVHTR